MDEREFSEVANRLEEVNKVITKLDPQVRASAFEVFKKYVVSGYAEGTQIASKQDDAVETAVDSTVIERLISEHGANKPSRNLYLLAAAWYSEYGCHPFTRENIHKRAELSGLTIPARVDKTLGIAAEKGKKLFQTDGSGFRPTVPGEMYFKQIFKVKKGTDTPPATDAS